MTPTASRCRLFAAILLGACLGFPLRAWSSPDLCQGQGGTISYEEADLTLVSVTIDGTDQAPSPTDAGVTGNLSSPDNTGMVLANLPGVSDGGERLVYLTRGSR